MSSLVVEDRAENPLEVRVLFIRFCTVEKGSYVNPNIRRRFQQELLACEDSNRLRWHAIFENTSLVYFTRKPYEQCLQDVQDALQRTIHATRNYPPWQALHLILQNVDGNTFPDLTTLQTLFAY
jgi:hypothetical protein